MVRPTQPSPLPPPPALSTEVAVEQLKALLGLFQQMNDLMGDWGRRSKTASDASVIGVAEYYQTLCRDLDQRMGELQRALSTMGSAVDMNPLVAARRHLAVVLALKPANLIEAEHDIREGRTMTLEQMRRELRNPAH